MIYPLNGLRVLSLGQYISAPYCTLLLADAGAEVIKIERPDTGDPRRAIPPIAAGQDGAEVAGGFIAYNRNKKSVALNLRTAEGQRIVKALAAQSDVLVENLRPGVVEKLGLDYNTLRVVNPRLVYASISGFGRSPDHRGPYSERPTFDIVAEAMSGMMDLVGFADKPPSWTIYGLADVYSGQVTAYGIMLALFMRERCGEGQFVDSAMLDNMIALNERMIMLYSITGEEPRRGNLQHLYPRGAYHCQDGYLALVAPNDLIWARICRVIGREDLIDDPRSANGTARASNAAFLDPILSSWLAERTRAEAAETLNAYGVPAGPIHTARDVFDSPQVAAREVLVEVDDPQVGPHRFARTPPLLSAAPRIRTDPAPRLGQHTREVLRELLGYDETTIMRLEQEKVLRTAV